MDKAYIYQLREVVTPWCIVLSRIEDSETSEYDICLYHANIDVSGFTIRCVNLGSKANIYAASYLIASCLSSFDIELDHLDIEQIQFELFQI